MKRQAVGVAVGREPQGAARFRRQGPGAKPMTGFGDPVFNPAAAAGAEHGAGARPQIRVPQPESGAYTDFWQGAGVDLANGSARRCRNCPTPLTNQRGRQELGAAASDIHLGTRRQRDHGQAPPLADYRIIYFATHGLVAGDIKGLAEPSLALSIPKQPSELDDGLLTASEVAQLKLNADWVVLSACNTIAGDKPGAEALSGLARSFFYAGARALLVTHWSVASDAATRLTTATFDNLKADPTSAAPKPAPRHAGLLADTSAPRNAYPAIWGPFRYRRRRCALKLCDFEYAVDCLGVFDSLPALGTGSDARATPVIGL